VTVNNRKKKVGVFEVAEKQQVGGNADDQQAA
jgi:hypothetical protein